ncbi:hypothetical protein BGX24_005967, partial [Mortierella sp. AD032]
MCSPVVFRTLDMSRYRRLEQLLLDDVVLEIVGRRFPHVRSLQTTPTFLGCYLRSLALRASPIDTPSWLPLPTPNLSSSPAVDTAASTNVDSIANADGENATVAGTQAAAAVDPLSGLPVLSNLKSLCCTNMLVYEWLQTYYKVPIVPWQHLTLQIS